MPLCLRPEGPLQSFSLGKEYQMNASLKSSVSKEFDIGSTFNQFMNDIGLSSEDIGGTVTFTGADPIFESRFRQGACISIPIMRAAAGAAIVWRMRTGRGQNLALDLRKAIHGINPVYKFKPTINGYAYQMPYAIGNYTIFDLYLIKDGRWVLPTGGYPHMLAEWSALLRCSPAKASITNSILTLNCLLSDWTRKYSDGRTSFA